MPEWKKAILDEIDEIPEEHLPEFLKIVRTYKINVAQKHPKPNRTLGLFADEPELVDEILESAMKDRKRMPLRAKE